MTPVITQVFSALSLVLVSFVTISVICIVQVPQDVSAVFYSAVLTSVMNMAWSCILLSAILELVQKMLTLVAFCYEHRSETERAISSYYKRAEKEVNDESPSVMAIRTSQLEVSNLMKELLQGEIENRKLQKGCTVGVENEKRIAELRATLDEVKARQGDSTSTASSESFEITSDGEAKKGGNASPAACSAASTV